MWIYVYSRIKHKMTFYYITAIRTEIHNEKRYVNLSEGKNPDDACEKYYSFWRTVDRILKIEEATWSKSDQRWVIKRTGKFPRNWCD